MSQLSDYRHRIKSLLSGDVEQKLLAEGLSQVAARAIGNSRAVLAQRSLIRRGNALSKSIPEHADKSETGKD